MRTSGHSPRRLLGSGLPANVVSPHSIDKAVPDAVLLNLHSARKSRVNAQRSNTSLDARHHRTPRLGPWTSATCGRSGPRQRRSGTAAARPGTSGLGPPRSGTPSVLGARQVRTRAHARRVGELRAATQLFLRHHEEPVTPACMGRCMRPAGSAATTRPWQCRSCAAMRRNSPRRAPRCFIRPVVKAAMRTGVEQDQPGGTRSCLHWWRGRCRRIVCHRS